jgi:extracellular factor (EF) 3-hydroxypalmitic acid methyl ester biosynthesis protein
VLSVACGPCAELGDMMADPERAARCELTLLDQDPEALGEAQAAADAASVRIGQRVNVRLIHESVRTMLRTPDLRAAWGEFDFVYTMGLFDYLQPPVARVVLHKLYELLGPGGELTVGNFHVLNPTRMYMEYWMDWVLVYRHENEMLELTAGLPGAESAIEFEDTKSQMFLRVRRTA